MAAISVGRFVPVPGQIVYLTDRASPQFVAGSIRLLITAESKPSTVDARQGHSARNAAWLALTGYELGPRGQRLVLRENVAAYAEGIVLCGEPGVRTRRPHSPTSGTQGPLG